ncbi:MAG: PTS sugar transporter subunit IIA [bacterium]|nr:PTS sugar transporter subunit IIA [bacterium]
MMKLYNSLKPENIRVDIKSTDTEVFLQAMIQGLNLNGHRLDQEVILDKLVEREKLGSTSIGNHSAVPHTKLKELKDPIISIGTSRQGIHYHESDKEPVHLVILILSPDTSPIVHLQILAAAASLIKRKGRLIKDLLAAETGPQLIRIVEKYETSDD